MINLFQPFVGADELSAVEAVFTSKWLGTGDRVKDLEREFATYVGVDPSNVVAVTSGTEALFQVVEALGLGPGDDVVLPTVSFIGAAHAVRAAGARAVLCDVDPATLNPTEQHVRRALTRSTKAVLVLHYGGLPGAVAELAELATERSLSLIEDTAVGLGSSVDGRACGTFGDAAIWSFDSMKIMTTGDGGMAWFKDVAAAESMRARIRHGLGSSGFSRRKESGRWWEIDPPILGRKATMNDVAASIGLVQLARLETSLARRRQVAATYAAALEDLTWMTVVNVHPADAARTFFWIQTAPGVRDRLARHLLARGVYTNYQYWPLHRTDMFRTEEEFPGADAAAASTLLLPLHQGLTDSEVTRVVDEVRAFVP